MAKEFGVADFLADAGVLADGLACLEAPHV